MKHRIHNAPSQKQMLVFARIELSHLITLWMLLGAHVCRPSPEGDEGPHPPPRFSPPTRDGALGAANGVQHPRLPMPPRQDPLNVHLQSASAPQFPMPRCGITRNPAAPAATSILQWRNIREAPRVPLAYDQLLGGSSKPSTTRVTRSLGSYRNTIRPFLIPKHFPNTTLYVHHYF